MKRLALLAVVVLTIPAPAQSKVAGWQLATSPDRCLSFNTLADGPPLQIGLLHEQGGPWAMVVGTDVTASLPEGKQFTVKFEYQNGFARREYPARVARLGRSLVVVLASAPATFKQFDPADISPPQALLLVEEVGKPFTLTDAATGAVMASGKVPANFGAAFTEFVACAQALEGKPANSPR